jgi:hypothetical protein
VKAWIDRVYYEGDVVTCDGSLWQACRDTGQKPGHPDWLSLAVRGLDARSPTVRGTYSVDATYNPLDIVALNGGSFIARSDDPGQCPGENWQLLTRQGKTGTAGEKGPPGDRGPKGEQGAPGAPAPRIKGWKLDPARYVATPLMDNGQEDAPLDLRKLFEAYHNESQ